MGKDKAIADINKLVFDLVNKLPNRPKEVIIKRYNLDGNGEKTLDKIGKEFGVTRERVRQIEVEGIAKLKSMAKKHEISKVLDLIKENIDSCGGLMSEDNIVKFLFGSETENVANKQIVLLILSLDDRIKKMKEIRVHKNLYYYDDKNIEKFKEIMEEVEKRLLDSNEHLELENIIDIANECVEKKGFNKMSKESIETYLEANKIILKNILNQYGHVKWPSVSPKSIKDKAYLALKKGKEMLHFTKIADEINKIWTDGKKKANKQTVHNELIKDKRFVLVGRGIYALKEWGYNPGIVLEVIIEILKEKGQMTQDEIVAEVLKRRKVKKNTITLNLQTKKFFEKLPGKAYRLKNN